MFADSAKIFIKSGKGGDGHVSFRRELYVPAGGPDGGDGGRGGDIIFVVDEGLNTLTDFRHVRKYVAQPGEEGAKRNQHGKDGKDLIIKVPLGTIIKEAESGKVIADMSSADKKVTVLKGGRGGKGNPKLITWDYGKEITVNIEDALFSPKSMAIMLGNGKASDKVSSTVTRTVAARIQTGGDLDYITCDVYDPAEAGAVRKKVDMKLATASATNPRTGMINFASAGITVNKVTYEDGTAAVDPSVGDGWTYAEVKGAASSERAGQKMFITYTQNVMKSEIVVSSDTFPGTYYVTGDTYARSDVTGKDSFFQFVIPKCKVTAENTITLEAEGDPSTFSMNLTVLRPEDGEMMKLVQYDLDPVSAG